MDVKKLLLMNSTVPFVVKNMNCLREVLEDDDDEGPDIIEIITKKDFFEEVVPNYSDEEFIRYFCIPRYLFEQLAQDYNDSDLYKQTHQHLVTSARKSLAVFLWFCSHEALSFRDLENLFHLSRSTVSYTIRRLICFLSCLAPRVIRWPTPAEMKAESEYHLQKYGIPGVIGAVDGTHIRIDRPVNNNDDSYVNRKGHITLVVQAVCDHRNMILHASIGYPGSVHDARAFRVSSLPELLDDTPIGYRLLGDAAYPLSPKLMTPYRNTGHLTAAQVNFNVQLHSSRVMIEHTFEIIKQRFRQLYYYPSAACPSNDSDTTNAGNMHNKGKALRDLICAGLPIHKNTVRSQSKRKK